MRAGCSGQWIVAWNSRGGEGRCSSHTLIMTVAVAVAVAVTVAVTDLNSCPAVSEFKACG